MSRESKGKYPKELKERLYTRRKTVKEIVKLITRSHLDPIVTSRLLNLCLPKVNLYQPQ
jgi:hypothetical protein